MRRPITSQLRATHRPLFKHPTHPLPLLYQLSHHSYVVSLSCVYFLPFVILCISSLLGIYNFSGSHVVNIFWGHSCQHNDRSARPPAATFWYQGRESSWATGHSRRPARKRGTACQSTSGHLKLSLHSRVAWRHRHICLNSRTARSEDSSDVVMRPCSD